MKNGDFSMNDTLDNFAFPEGFSQDIIPKEKSPKYVKSQVSFDESAFLKDLTIDFDALNSVESNKSTGIVVRKPTPTTPQKIHKFLSQEKTEKSAIKYKNFDNAENTKDISTSNQQKQQKKGKENVPEIGAKHAEDKVTKSKDIQVIEKSNIHLNENVQKLRTSKQNSKQKIATSNYLPEEVLTTEKKSTILNHNLKIRQNCSPQQVRNQTEIKTKGQESQSDNEVVEKNLGTTTKSHIPNELLDLSCWGLPLNILEKYQSRKIVSMFPWQVECLKNPKVLHGMSNLIYSAPTSAGKTLVSEILALKTIFERKKKDILGSSGIRAEGFMGSYNPPGGFSSIQLAICTIEKANSLINRLLEEGNLSDIGAVLVDEMHLLGDPHRGYLLELLLTKLRYVSLKQENVQIQIIGMSATLPNLDQLAKWLKAELYSTQFRPIPLYEQIIVNGEIYDKQLKFVRKLKGLQNVETGDTVLQLCLETINENCSVLIFCPTKNRCESLAQQISSAISKIGCSDTEQGQLLRAQIKRELILEVLEQLKFCPVGLDEVLRKTVSFGVAYHHAGLTMDERDIIESGFRNGSLRVLIATSTLSSGVNLPARRVIIRTPNFHGKIIDLLTYRQMIGRAGRLGKDTLGESFLVCQQNEYNGAKELLSGDLPPVQSCLEGDGKLKRAILEVIASGVASSPEDVKLFASCTLLASVDEEENSDDEAKDSVTNPIDDAVNFLIKNEFIRLQKSIEGDAIYTATNLGKACLSSSIAPDEGLALFTELERARQSFVLESELHLIYLVTPYSACYSWGNIDWMFYLDLYDKLPKSMKKVGQLVGVMEGFLVNAARGKIDTTRGHQKLMIHKRFFVALALQDLVNEKPLGEVCDKFTCNRGMLQSLQQSASTFAGMVTSFSRQLGWSSVELLLSQFQDRMHFGVSRDLLDLMRLPSVNGKIARTLYNAGIETAVQLANSNVETIENILYKAAPFESTKQKEGESHYENIIRNKLRTVFVTGKDGLTEKEAAELLIADARKYLQIEMGLKEAKWTNDTLHQDTSIPVGVEKDSNTENEIKLEDLSCKDEQDCKTTKKHEASNNLLKIQEIPEPKYGKTSADSSKIEDFSNSSISSLDLNISTNSSLNCDRKTSILNAPIQGQNHSVISDENIRITKETSIVDVLSSEISENSNSNKKCENKHLSQPSNNIATYDKNCEFDISDSSLFDDINFTNIEKMVGLDKNNSHLKDNSPTEDTIPHQIDSSREINTFQSLTPNSSTKDEGSNQGSFEASFTLQLSDNSSVPTEDVMDRDLKADALKNNETDSKDRRRKRGNEDSESEDSFLEATPTKKRKSLENEKNLSPEHEAVVYEKLIIVDVTKNDSVFESFKNEVLEQSSISFSLACDKYEEDKPVIGQNLLESLSCVFKDHKSVYKYKHRKVEGFAISCGKNHSFYVSLEKPNKAKSSIDILKKLFEKQEMNVKMFDAKEQIKLLKNCCDVDVFTNVEDPKIQNWLLEPEENEQSLTNIALKNCLSSMQYIADMAKSCKAIGSMGLFVKDCGLSPRLRASIEAVLVWHVVDSLREKIRCQIPKCQLSNDVPFLNSYDLEMKTLLCLSKMELNGISVNKTSLQNMADILRDHQNTIERRAFSHAGRRFNFNSASEIAKVTGLFNGKKVSTKKEVLEKSEHPISELVMLWRKINFTLTKMVCPLIQAVENHRIWGCYVTHTASGRISMHEPNLQMVTKDFTFSDPLKQTDITISCRSAFEAPEGHTLISADFCQLELRILTYLSKDTILEGIMQKPGDVFKMIAAKWNNLTEDRVDENMRQNTKQLCYGIFYGMGTKTLADQLNISEDEATHFVESFKNAYPGIKQYVQKTIMECRKNGFVETVNGRRRYLPCINDPNSQKKAQAERQAVNTTIQGSAADLAKNAMLTVEEKIAEIFKKSSKRPILVLHLHDELIYEAADKYIEKVAKLMKKFMEKSAASLGHFPVKVKTGKSWGDLKEYQF